MYTLFFYLCRLRKYVGNVKEWGLQGKELEDFGQQAEKIRSEAEKIYNKIKVSPEKLWCPVLVLT